MSCNNIMLTIMPTLYAGYIVSSVHRVVMENRPVEPGSNSGVFSDLRTPEIRTIYYGTENHPYF